MSEARTLLIISKIARLGDNVMLLPALRALARRTGVPCLVWTRPNSMKDLCLNLPYIAEVHEFQPLRWRLPYPLSPGQWAWVKRLRGHRFVEVLIWENKRKRRAKYMELTARALDLRTSSDGFGFRLLDDHTNDDRHMMLWGLSAVGESPPFASDIFPELVVSANEAASARLRLSELGWKGEPVITLHPGMATTQKYGAKTLDEYLWPVDRWPVVAKAVRRELPGARFLVTGSAAERFLTGRVASLLASKAGEPVNDLAGLTSLRELIALQSLAHSHIGMDSGTAHTAAAAGCRTVSIARHSLPSHWRPIGRRGGIMVHAPWPYPEKPTMEAWEAWHRPDMVSADMVIAAWKSML